VKAAWRRGKNKRAKLEISNVNVNENCRNGEKPGENQKTHPKKYYWAEGTDGASSGALAASRHVFYYQHQMSMAAAAYEGLWPAFGMKNEGGNGGRRGGKAKKEVTRAARQ
jgi:hypothetical protein